MIKLSDAEKMLLEDQFEGVPDRDLIRELVRRERLRQVCASVAFWPEMREDDRYMSSVRERVIYTVARGIADSDTKPALIVEQDQPSPKLVLFSDGEPMYGQCRLDADVVFLVARNKAEG